MLRPLRDVACRSLATGISPHFFILFHSRILRRIEFFLNHLRELLMVQLLIQILDAIAARFLLVTRLILQLHKFLEILSLCLLFHRRLRCIFRCWPLIFNLLLQILNIQITGTILIRIHQQLKWRQPLPLPWCPRAALLAVHLQGGLHLPSQLLVFLSLCTLHALQGLEADD